MSLDDAVKAGERVLADADQALEAAGAPPVERRRRPDRRADRYLPKFKCPMCGELATSHVLEGRPNYADGSYWRRHRCDACHDTFTSKQAIEPISRPSTKKRTA